MTQIVSVRQNGKKRVQTGEFGESKTVQSDNAQAEIHEVLRKYRGVGIVDHLAQVDLQFRDVTQFEDFQDLMRQTKEAEGVFMRLPSKLREVFNHDVNRWLDCAHDAEKLAEIRPQLEKLGVMEPVKAPQAPPAPVAPPVGGAE